jgi:bifunctional DNA-binding transcriptional regulator/antitoxin component of YhaV-PrlF toxin-antitoxin module
MDYRVGAKGQVVIDQNIRRTLGVGPGWLAAQRLVEDHVEIRFFPPEHNRSLRGILANPKGPSISLEEWPEARERMWAEYAAEEDKRVVAEAMGRKRRVKTRKKQ